jgi:acylglycerol lipase
MLSEILSLAPTVVTVGGIVYLVIVWFRAWMTHDHDGHRRRFDHPLGAHPKPTPDFHKHTSLEFQDGFIDILGKSIYFQSFRPLGCKPRGVTVVYHGYGDHCDFTMHEIAHDIARDCDHITIVFDQPGFGRSDGLWGFIPDWFVHVDTCVIATRAIRDKVTTDEEKELPLFACGHSMGGGVAITATVQYPDLFDGLVLIAPMCGIAETVRPHKAVERVFVVLAQYLKTLPITPVANPGYLCFEDPTYYKTSLAMNRLCYKGRARLGTAKSLLSAQDWIAVNAQNITTPLLVLQGDRDFVTSLDKCVALFNEAKSEDKTLHILHGHYHVLIGPGQPREKSEKVLGKVVAWLTCHSVE